MRLPGTLLIFFLLLSGKNHSQRIDDLVSSYEEIQCLLPANQEYELFFTNRLEEVLGTHVPIFKKGKNQRKGKRTSKTISLYKETITVLCASTDRIWGTFNDFGNLSCYEYQGTFLFCCDNAGKNLYVFSFMEGTLGSQNQQSKKQSAKSMWRVYWFDEELTCQGFASYLRQEHANEGITPDMGIPYFQNQWYFERVFRGSNGERESKILLPRMRMSSQALVETPVDGLVNDLASYFELDEGWDHQGRPQAVLALDPIFGLFLDCSE